MTTVCALGPVQRTGSFFLTDRESRSVVGRELGSKRVPLPAPRRRMKTPRNSSSLPLLLASLAGAVLVAAPAAAADTDNQAWGLFTLQAPLGKRWLGYMELQPRFSEDLGGAERLLVRPAIGYRLSRNVSLWQGYAFVPQFRPTSSHEHRPFQQLLVDTRVGKAQLTNRTRLEERVLPGADGTSLRFRQMLRFAHPISKDRRWSVVGYDEFFFNLNSVGDGPQSGFDQNRLYLGIARQVNPKTRVELGYIWTYIDGKGGAADRSLNILFTGVAVNL